MVMCKNARKGVPMNYKELKSEMDRQKVSVQQLASMSGVDRATIYRIIGGETECNIETARKIATALKLKPKQVTTIFFEN
jgi:gp16 family phage-associated protein